MPFIGYGFATAYVPLKRDYFGFRNALGSDVHYAHSRPLIVINGNSELAGLYHTTTIADLLQAEYHRRRLMFDVLNLCTPGYTLAGELSVYLQFGDRVCPSLVIAHPGVENSYYVLVVPARFRKLGLNYHPPTEEWSYRSIELRLIPVLLFGVVGIRT